MIIVAYRWETAIGKTEAGLEWSKKTGAYAKKAGLLPPKYWTLRPITGDIHKFTIAEQYASMAEYEETRAKRAADSGFQALVKEQSDWLAGLELIISEVVDEG